MNEKKFEECSLEDATHVEVNRVIYNVAGNICRYNNGLGWVKENTYIREELFSILGINPLREIKPEPIEFEAVFAKYDGQWRQLLTIDDGFPIRNCKVAKFKCVEIWEDEE